MNFQWLLFDPFIRGSSQQRDCPGFPPDSLLITREGKPLAIYFAKYMLILFLVQIYADIYFCRLCSSLVTIKRRNTSITD